jgi:CDP-glucose 4,6-dehydratase
LENLVNLEFLNHFKGKKVLVTGHTGFKGSWLTFLLHYLGAEVTGFALSPNTSPNLFDLLEVHTKCDSIIADVNDAKAVSNAVEACQPDFILHLAAQPLVRYSYKQPLETFATNVMGTANLLDACKSLNKNCTVVCITTDKVYHNNEWEFPYRENDRLGGYDPYSASKAAAEIVIDSYRNSFFKNSKISIASVRAGNVIGGGDWSEDRLFPDLINSIANNKPIELRNPTAVRPWQHVLDPISGYLKLAYQMDTNPSSFNEAWNFGPYNHDSLTVLEVCQKAIAVFQKGSIQIDQNKHPHEAGQLRLDISKAVFYLDWQPTWSTEEAIQKTANWYKLFLAGEDALSLVQQDINVFLKS